MKEKVVTKTIEEWLNELEEPYRTQAIENTKRLAGTERLYEPADNITDALMSAFIWETSPEGYEYWSDLFGKYLEQENENS